MKTRATMKLALFAALIMAPLAVTSASGDDSQKFKMRFAGGFIKNIQQMQVGPFNIPTGVMESRAIALLKGRGTFGRADIMAVSVDGPPMSGKVCSSGLPKIADIVENNFVMTFGDLSLLYGNGSGVVCPDPNDPSAPPIAEIDGTFDGGTGRFAHAGGTWTSEFYVFVPVGAGVGPDTQFVAETGAFKGRITGVRKKDD